MDYESEYEYEGEEDYAYEEEGDDPPSYGAETSQIASPPLSQALSSVAPSEENSGKGLSRQVTTNSELLVPFDNYILKPAHEIHELLKANLRDVAVLLACSLDEAQILLQAYKWDKEKLFTCYFADMETVRSNAGLHIEPNVLYAATPSDQPHADAVINLVSHSSGALTEEVRYKCRICCAEELLAADGLALSCGHWFCIPCYREYLKVQVSDGVSCVVAHCPEFQCKCLVPRHAYEKLLSAEDLQKYDSYVLRNYISNSKAMRHCPAPRCTKVAVGSGVTSIHCDCGNPFCFKCGEEAHDPCSCSQLGDWTEKCLNESETANWILANTRKCPACNTRIEKNQGCNHMSCKICKHEFCWICMGPWSDHGQNTGGFYKCNRFDASEANAAVSAAQKAKAELDRYLHFYQRYHAHDQAQKVARNSRETTERRMIEQQESQRAQWFDVQFLKHAVEQVIDCRRVLKYTYVLGYYLKESTAEKQLFEHHQEMLEKNTERLQEFIERPVVAPTDRTAVVNLTRVTGNFMASLLQTMAGGVVRLEEQLTTSTASAADAIASQSKSGKSQRSG